jgi:hypothetical protein
MPLIARGKMLEGFQLEETTWTTALMLSAILQYIKRFFYAVHDK